MKAALLGNWKNLTPIDIAGATLATVMVLAFLFGVLGPVALRQQHAAALRQEALRQQQRARALAASNAALAKQLEQTRAQLAAMPMQVLPTTAMNQRLAAMLNQAAASGLTVSDLKPASAIRGSRFVAIPVTLTCRGGYVTAADFLHALHDRFSDVGVCGFRLENNPARKQASFTIDLHWLAQPAFSPQIATAE